MVSMDAQHWLATVFGPTLHRESLAYTNDADLLRGQLAALHDCGVLDDEAYRDALRRLDAPIEAAHQQAHFDVRPVGTAEPALAPTIRAATSAGGRPATGRR
jgi:hypothetical protein